MINPRKSFYRPLRKDIDDESHAWLLTFADAVTLLLAFFVMLLSFSKVDIVSFEEVKAGIARDLGQRSIARPAAQLRAELDAMVDSLGVAETLEAPTYSKFKIATEGHTDDMPIANDRFASNWELSAARATEVVRLFETRNIPVRRMRAVAFADTQPRAPNRDSTGAPLPENQAKNRRVIIRVHR